MRALPIIWKRTDEAFLQLLELPLGLLLRPRDLRDGGFDLAVSLRLEDAQQLGVDVELLLRNACALRQLGVGLSQRFELLAQLTEVLRSR